MIESRYKIEYVLPDDGIKKSSSFKVLWYLLLIPLILVAVAAITYDFSLQNIRNDSLVLVEKVKIQIFNLGDNTHAKKPENTKGNSIIKPVPVATVTSTERQKKTLRANLIVPETKNNNNLKNTKTITELTLQQELQLKTINEQIKKNTRLSDNLNKLSTQLVAEKTKNETLNNKLSEQEKDRTELAEQLNKILAESDNNEITLEKFTPELIETSTIPKPTSSEVTVERVESIESSESVQNSSIKVTENNEEDPKTIINKSPGKSETDKIIEAMATINPIAEEEEPKELAIETEIVKPEPETVTNSDKENINQEKSIVDIPKENIKDAKPLTAFNLAKEPFNSNETPQELDEDIVFEIGNSLTKKTGLLSGEKETSITEPEVATEQTVLAPQADSSVDDIVAAMQEAQSEVSINSPDANPNMNLELEKDIKRQLVEKGDVSIDDQ